MPRHNLYVEGLFLLLIVVHSIDTHTYLLICVHAHTHTLAYIRTLSHTHSCTHTLSLSHTHAHTLSLSRTHAHTHSLTHTLSHTLIHTHSLSHTLMHTHFAGTKINRYVYMNHSNLAVTQCTCVQSCTAKKTLTYECFMSISLLF